MYCVVLSFELYPILRNAVSELAPDLIMALCQGMEQRFPTLWPRELHWDEFSQEIRRDREQWISTLVEQTDRFDGLPLLLDYTALSARMQEPDVRSIWIAFSETINQALAARLGPTA